MRVYDPRKESQLLREVLKDLYLLKQAIEHQAGSLKARVEALDNINKKIRSVVDLIEDNGTKK
jgi:hypothetical protein|tara:strand:+ start:1674 stop:1862 length:189 start_codon:yes stop_codon:yes gene_type:complete